MLHAFRPFCNVTHHSSVPVYIDNFSVQGCTIILGLTSNVICCMILEKCIDLFLYFVFLVVILKVLTTVFKSEGPCLIANLSCVRRVFKLYL